MDPLTGRTVRVDDPPEDVDQLRQQIRELFREQHDYEPEEVVPVSELVAQKLALGERELNRRERRRRSRRS